MSNASSKLTAPNEPLLEQQKVPWNPWLAIVFAVLVYYGSQLAAGLLVYIYPAARHWPDSRAFDWMDTSVNAQFIFIVLAEILTLGALYLFLRHYRFSFSSLGLKKLRAKDLLYGLAAVPAYFILYLIVVGVFSYLVPSLDVDQTQQIGFDNVAGGLQLAMTFVSLVVLPPLAEEIMVRGFLYSSLKKALPLIPAALITSAIFASAHLPEGGDAGPLYIAAIDTFVLSLVLIYLREKSGSLWPCITLHAIKNGIAFTALFVFHVH